MVSYQLKLDVLFFNICVYGDISLDEDLQKIHYWNHDLAEFGFPGTIMIGETLSSLIVAAKNSESDDPEMLTPVEVIVDEEAERRGDAFFEKVMPIGAEGLSIVQVADSDSLPLINHEEVFIPVSWIGPSTIQLIAPGGFVRTPENNFVVTSLRIVVSPEIPQP